MAIERLKLKKLPNIRDLGGFKTKSGKQIVYGKLFRSGKLYKLNKKTKRAIEDMHLSHIIDLRIETERLEKPNTEIKGTTMVNLPLLCTATPAITAEKSMRVTIAKESKRIKKEFETADNYMIEMYKRVLLNDQSKQSIKAVLDIILNADGVLWHCNGGKDRAGLIAMIVEGLLGLDDEKIIEDYVISHKYQQKKLFWSKFGLSIAFTRTQFKRIIINMLSAKPTYIIKTLEFINTTYGGIENYAKTELGITDEYIEKLRAKYLE